MALDKERSNISNMLGAFIAIGVFTLILLYLIFNDFIVLDSENLFQSFLLKYVLYISDNYTIFILLYLSSVVLSGFFIPNIKLSVHLKQKTKNIYHVLSVITSILLFFGFSKFIFYNVVIFPGLFISNVYFVAVSASSFKKGFKDENNIFGVSNKTGDPLENVSFNVKPVIDVIDVKLGSYEKLNFHSINQGIFIEGGAGSGKSASIIYPMIYQRIAEGCPLVIYDYEGDPTDSRNRLEDKSPILTRYAYSALKKYQKIEINGKTISNPLKFAFVNFVDMSRTHRVNPVSRKYIEEADTQAILEIMDVFSKALNLEWNKKKDFWADNGIAIIQAVQMYLWRNHDDDGFNTIPHMISLILEDYPALFRMLSTDEFVSKMIAPVLVAFKQAAHGQLAGAVASAQFPPRKLYDPKIYWVLSEDEIDLRTATIDNPHVFCIGNSPNRKNTLNAPISLILTMCMRNLNQGGNLNNSLIIDELPTLNLNADELSNFPNTARKNGCNLTIAVQTRDQLLDLYGKEKTGKILGSCANIFHGMVNSYEIADAIAKQFGKIKRHNISMSHQQGSTTHSENMQFEDVIQGREIMGFPKGRFIGKVSDGEPQNFYAQFEYIPTKWYDLVDEIPPFAISNEIDSNEFSEEEKNNYNLQILNSRVQHNFKKIEDEAKMLLAPFRQEESKPVNSKGMGSPS